MYTIDFFLPYIIMPQQAVDARAGGSLNAVKTSERNQDREQVHPHWHCSSPPRPRSADMKN